MQRGIPYGHMSFRSGKEEQVHITCNSGTNVVKVHEYCHSFDYSGIVVLTVGSFYPCIYYGFFCRPVFQAIYLIAISITGIGE